MSIKRNLDETSIVNYICKKQSTISLCDSKESYPKIKRANQRLSANLKSDFLCHNCSTVGGGEKRRDFCARRGAAKRRPGSALMCAEDATRSRDAA